MQHLRLWRILLGVFSGVALVALSLGVLTVSSAQAQGPGQRVVPSQTKIILMLLSQQVEIQDSNGADLGIGVFKANIRSDPESDRLRGTAHLQIENDQYQFNFKELEDIIRDGGNPIGIELSGQGEQSGYGPFDVTARIDARSDEDGIFILINGMPLPSVGLQFEAEGSFIFEEPNPRQ